PRRTLLPSITSGTPSDQAQSVDADLNGHYLTFESGIPALNEAHLLGERVMFFAAPYLHTEIKFDIGGAFGNRVLQQLKLFPGIRLRGSSHYSGHFGCSFSFGAHWPFLFSSSRSGTAQKSKAGLPVESI